MKTISEDRKQIFNALSKAQSEIVGAIKDSTNPHYKSQYADLESVWQACREPLTKHGLAVTQLVTYVTINDHTTLAIETILTHSSGEFISTVSPINPIKADPQGVGSAITYMRRYALAAIVGVYQTDDDANAACAKPVLEPKKNVFVEVKKEKVLSAENKKKIIDAMKTHKWQHIQVTELVGLFYEKEIFDLTNEQIDFISGVISEGAPETIISDAKQLREEKNAEKVEQKTK